MAAAQVDGMGIFNRGEPAAAGDPISGNTGGFAWFSRGEVFAWYVEAAASTLTPQRMLMGVGS